MTAETDHTSKEPISKHKATNEHTANILQRELGISPAQARLDLIIGNDLLTSPDQEMLLEDTNILVGELNFAQLRNLQTAHTPPDQKLLGKITEEFKSAANFTKDPSLNLNVPQHQYHWNTIRDLIKKGVSVVATDADLDSLFGKNFQDVPLGFHSAVAMTTIILLTAGSMTASLYVDRKNNKLTRRSFLKAMGIGAGTVAASALSASVGGRILRDSVTNSVGRNTLAEAAVNREIKYEKLKDKVQGKKEPFATYTQRKVKLRNDIMLLNSINTLASAVSTDQEGPLKIALFCGVGHGEIEDILTQGIDSLVARVTGYTENLCNQTLDYLISTLDQDTVPQNNSEDKTYQALKGLASMFSEPVWFGNQEYAENLASNKIPPTAGSILINSLSNTLSNLKEMGDPSDPRTARKISLLSKLLIATSKSVRARTLEANTGTAIILGNPDSESELRVPNSTISPNITYEYNYLTANKPDRDPSKDNTSIRLHSERIDRAANKLIIPIGTTQYRGRTLPLIKVLQTGPTPTIDDIALYGNLRLVFSTTQYSQVDKRSITKFAEPKVVASLSRYEPDSAFKDSLSILVESVMPAYDLPGAIFFKSEKDSSNSKDVPHNKMEIEYIVETFDHKNPTL